MTAKVAMPVRDSDLVVPLAHEATAMRNTDTARHQCEAASGAVSTLSNRRGDVQSTNGRSTRATTLMPTPSISATATRTTTTRTTSAASASSADERPFPPADFSFRDVVVAHLDCRHHKRNTAACQEFERDLATNLYEIYEALIDRTYRPWRSNSFVITEPKVREVIAAQYRDRVVHHLLFLKIGTRFTKTFIADTCACIPGRGTAYAARRMEHMVRSITQNWKKPAFYLKCDIQNFFPSIKKDIVHAKLKAKVTEPFWLWLAETILFHDPLENLHVKASADELARVPEHKRLCNQEDHCGLAIGNLPSQNFANILLDEVDQHVKHDLKCRRYGRYVDDMMLLDESAEWLHYAAEDIDAFLRARLGLQLHPKKTVVQPIVRGVDFVGQVIKPWNRRIRKRTANVALRRLATMDKDDVFEAANSYFGMHRQATHSHMDRARIARLLTRIGFSVNKNFTKVYRKGA